MSGIKTDLQDALEQAKKRPPSDENVAISGILLALLSEIEDYEDEVVLYGDGRPIPVNRLFKIRPTDRAIRKLAEAIIKKGESE